MALNWYLQLRNLSKTDEKASELMDLLQKATTDEEKESAKEKAKEYVETVCARTQEESNDRDTVDTKTTDREEENIVLEETERENNNGDSLDTIDNSLPDNEFANENIKQEEKALTDLSAPAFNPRLAKCGITREEELFLHGVFVRKMCREEKMLMRREIYQKKTVRNAQVQAEYRKKRIEQKQKDANDPEKQRYHQERKYVSAITNALEQHKNIGWIFSNIEGLTVDIVKEFIKKPAFVNAFNQANPNFITNFKKKYGE